MEQMRDQARHVGTEFAEETATSVDLSRRPFRIDTESGSYTAETLVLATGAQARWLGLPSEKEFRGYGVSACVTCDGFFFRNQHVAIIGGGNTAVEEALFMTNHASHVTLVHRRDSLRAEHMLQERLLAHPKVSVIWNSVVEEIIGHDGPRKAVKALLLRDVVTGGARELDVDGVFVAIGHTPASQLFRGQLDLDDAGYIRIAPWSTATSLEGVFSAGDVSDPKFRQAVTAAAMGCMAALEAGKFLAEHSDAGAAASRAAAIPAAAERQQCHAA
jgi:thioredoxin reductase (NADPH)